MPIRWVILDAMGVVFEVGDDVNGLLIPYLRDRGCQIASEAIHRLYMKASLGEMRSFELWRGLGLGDCYPEIEREYLDTSLRLDPHFAAVASELSKQYCLALLSNDVAEWSQHVRSRLRLNRFFRAVVISGEVGLRKPDEGIFAHLLDKMRALPSVCAFVDDRGKNLRTASRLGMKTIRLVRSGTDGLLPPDAADDAFVADAQIRTFNELPEALAASGDGRDAMGS